MKYEISIKTFNEEITVTTTCFIDGKPLIIINDKFDDAHALLRDSNKLMQVVDSSISRLKVIYSIIAK